jgi:predicted nucleic acid-binding protein
VAEALILDAEAVHALARASQLAALAERARAILSIAYERRALVRVPAPVLAEVCRGPRFDAAVDQLLKGHGILVRDLTRSTAQRAGALLASAKLASAHAVDAFVVATALEFDRAVIATGDPDDIRRLAAPFRQVSVFAV